MPLRQSNAKKSITPKPVPTKSHPRCGCSTGTTEPALASRIAGGRVGCAGTPIGGAGNVGISPVDSAVSFASSPTLLRMPDDEPAATPKSPPKSAAKPGSKFAQGPAEPPETLLAAAQNAQRFHPGEAITSRSFARVVSASFDALFTVDPHLHRIARLDDIYALRAEVVAAAPADATALELSQAVAQLGAQKPMLHSDQGVLYRCRAYRAQLAEAEITQSMSRKGNCWDNAPMESFFAVLKTECFHNRTFASIEALEAEIHEYIRYYNHERLSLKLKKLSPVAYRTQFATAA